MIEHIPCIREIGMKTTATHAHKNAHIVLLDFTLSGFPKPLGDTILTDELSSTTTNHLTANSGFRPEFARNDSSALLLGVRSHDRPNFGQNIALVVTVGWFLSFLLFVAFWLALKTPANTLLSVLAGLLGVRLCAAMDLAQ